MAEPVLKKGSNDPAVRDLQEALKVLGFDPGPVDGVFGAQTESAVKNFQQAREIPADGVVSRVTWINIDEADQSHPVLRTGSTGLPVRRLQSRMSAVGFDRRLVRSGHIFRRDALIEPGFENELCSVPDRDLPGHCWRPAPHSTTGTDK